MRRGAGYRGLHGTLARLAHGVERPSTFMNLNDTLRQASVCGLERIARRSQFTRSRRARHHWRTITLSQMCLCTKLVCVMLQNGLDFLSLRPAIVDTIRPINHRFQDRLRHAGSIYNHKRQRKSTHDDLHRSGTGVFCFPEQHASPL